MSTSPPVASVRDPGHVMRVRPGGEQHEGRPGSRPQPPMAASYSVRPRVEGEGGPGVDDLRTSAVALEAPPRVSPVRVMS